MWGLGSQYSAGGIWAVWAGGVNFLSGKTGLAVSEIGAVDFATGGSTCIGASFRPTRFRHPNYRHSSRMRRVRIMSFVIIGHAED
jgi:hypothetical protein